MVSDQIIFHLRQKIASGQSVYAIAKATGVTQSVIARFLSAERKQIRSETIDRLCEYLGLELVDRGNAGTTAPKSSRAAESAGDRSSSTPTAKTRRKAATVKPAGRKKATAKTGRRKK